jgi:hypothetical protein
MPLTSGEFAYVTSPETRPLRDGMARHYDEFLAVAKRLGEQLPPELLGTPTHLDPDFAQRGCLHSSTRRDSTAGFSRRSRS